MSKIDELRSRISEIEARQSELNTEYEGEMFPEAVAAEWKDLKAEKERAGETIAELEVRMADLESAAKDEKRQEKGAHFNVRTKKSDSDIYDLTAIRSESLGDPDRMTELLRDNALRSVETTRFTPPPDGGKNKEEVQGHIQELIDNDPFGEIAHRVLSTGSPLYKRAFAKSIDGKPLSSEEQRAMSTTNTAGGYAVPYALDPTIIATSNWSVNPYRAISKVVTITGSNTWQGVSTGGVTASRVIESGTASDGAPTFAQPQVTVTRVHSFVPFSYEIGQDLGNLQSEMTQLFQDAKDDEEATSFTTGSGTAPAAYGILGAQGLGTAAPPKVLTAGSAALVVGDIDSAQATLAARWRPRAVWVANFGFYQRVRRFYTAGGETLLANNQQGFVTDPGSPGGGIGYNLLGRPAYECTAINTTNVLTTGTKLAVFGDFSRGFAIVDRVGMNVEVIPNLFSGAAPIGQRGLYAWWRNNSYVIAGSAFVYLQTL